MMGYCQQKRVLIAKVVSIIFNAFKPILRIKKQILLEVACEFVSTLKKINHNRVAKPFFMVYERNFQMIITLELWIKINSKAID